MSLFIISAPSGCGKSTVIKAIRQCCPEFNFAVSATTRPPRPNETDGVHYFFYTESDFQCALRENKFLEHVYLDPYCYATLWSEMKKAKTGNMMLDVDVNGALAIRQRFPAAVLIMLTPPSMKELECRLRTRGDTPEQEIALRLARAEKELAAADKFGHVIVNDVLDDTISKVLKVIQDECKKANH